MFKVKPVFAWYDLWVGLFVDTQRQCLYFFPIPMFGLRVSWGRPQYLTCSDCVMYSEHTCEVDHNSRTYYVIEADDPICRRFWAKTP